MKFLYNTLVQSARIIGNAVWVVRRREEHSAVADHAVRGR
jgi:hypothetical protein